MKILWANIGFDPQNFEISEAEYDDMENFDNLGGDRKVLNTVHFPRQVDRSQLSESEKYTSVRIRNFPLEISEEEIVTFLKDNVGDEISNSDIKSEKTQYSTNIILGPGPNLELIAKATELLDYKTTSKTFFEERKLHVQLHRPLTPEKKEEGGIEIAIEEDATNKIKAVVSNINKVVETPKQPLPGKKSTQHSYASARKPSLDRHKSLFK